jgi:hypothetical protein
MARGAKLAVLARCLNLAQQVFIDVAEGVGVATGDEELINDFNGTLEQGSGGDDENRIAHAVAAHKFDERKDLIAYDLQLFFAG